MRLFLTKFFDRDYERLPRSIQKQCDKQLLILLRNPRHPSLRTSRIQGFQDIWEGRITREYRFTFLIVKDVFLVRRVGKHNHILKKP